MSTPLTAIRFHSTLADGSDNAGGKLWTYAAGTTTPQATYTTAARNVEQTNPVVLDSTGRASVFPDPALAYKWVLTDADGVAAPDGTVDNWTDADSLRPNLADSTSAANGAGLVGLGSLGYPVGTVGWHAQSRISVLDFFTQPQAADWLTTAPTLDHTAAFNLATKAAASYGAALYRQVGVPGGTYLLGAGNAKCFVRKGQHLCGAGMGATLLDVSASGTNTVPTITLGTNNAGVADSGGQVGEISALMFLGGPATAANIDTANCAGWSVHESFFSSPGIGVTAGGADGLLHDCIFDDGLSHVVVSGINQVLTDCLFYLGNFQITFATGAVDASVSSCQFEYPKFASILLSTGATGMRSLAVRDSNFLMNVQYGTFLGAILIASTAADLLVSGCTFRNLAGAGIKYSTGLGNVLVVQDSIFDGLKTVAAYAQSTTMQGVDASNMDTTIRGSTFRNLPGQPITFGGDEASTLVVENCRFSGNTGGTAEINITNTNPASKVIIRGCTGSGRPLVNDQATVPVIYENSNDGLGAEIIVATGATAAIVASTKSIIANRAGTVTVPLPTASLWPNRVVQIRTVTANAVVSAGGNVVPAAGGAAGTAILSGTAGKWASLRSDGTNWQIEAAN